MKPGRKKERKKESPLSQPQRKDDQTRNNLAGPEPLTPPQLPFTRYACATRSDNGRHVKIKATTANTKMTSPETSESPTAESLERGENKRGNNFLQDRRTSGI